MGHYYSPQIVTNGLIASLDASNPSSYPGSGTAIKDLTTNANATINGVISYVGAGSSSYWLWPGASSANYISSSVSQAYLDCTIIFYPDFSLVSDANLVGLIKSEFEHIYSTNKLNLKDSNISNVVKKKSYKILNPIQKLLKNIFPD